LFFPVELKWWRKAINTEERRREGGVAFLPCVALPNLDGPRKGKASKKLITELNGES
jgi:hypothetical protein